MSSRPVVFVSAVSRELRSTRDLVAKTLISLGYEPKWQDIAPTESGDLKAVLRKWVDESRAVIQIVGHRYGFAPGEPDPEFGQVSYTQYETFYARKKGKPVWYIILDENHPVDHMPDEPEELRKLQADYRSNVQAHHGLFHPSVNALATENIVLKLRNDLSALRRRSQQWAAAILTLIFLSIGGITWLIRAQGVIGERVDSTAGKMEAVIGGNSDLAAQVALIKASVDEVKRFQDPSAPPLSQEELDQALARNLGWSREKLRSTLAEGRMSENLLTKGQSLLVGGDIDEAEGNFDQVIASGGEATRRLRGAFEGKATIATSRGDFSVALAYREIAAALTSKDSEPLEWGAAQNEIVYLLLHLEDEERAAPLAKATLAFCDGHPPPDNPEVLVALNNLAQILQNEGQKEQALPLMRRALEISESTYGKYDPRIAITLNNLSQLHASAGRNEEARPLMERSIHIILKAELGKTEPGPHLSVALSNYVSLMGRLEMKKEDIEKSLLAMGKEAGWDTETLKAKIVEHALKHASGGHADKHRTMQIVICPSCYSENKLLVSSEYKMWFRCWNCANAFQY